MRSKEGLRFEVDPWKLKQRRHSTKKEEYVTHMMKVTEDLTTLALNQLFGRHLERLPGQWKMDVFDREEWAGLSGMQVLEHCLMWVTITFDLVSKTIPEDTVTFSVLKWIVYFAMTSAQKQNLLI